MSKDTKKLTASKLALEDGAEWGYVAGVPLSAIQAYGHGIITPTAGIGITLGWNYLDGIAAIGIGMHYIMDDDTAQRNKSFLLGAMNIVSGIQIMTLSYNPALVTALGLSGGALVLAPTAFTITMMSDLVTALVEMLNAKKLTSYNNWRAHQEKQVSHYQQRIEKLKRNIDKLNASKEAFTHVDNARFEKIDHETIKLQHKMEMLLTKKAACRQRADMSEQEWSTTEKDKLTQHLRETKINTALRFVSLAGMAMISAASFVACPPLLLAGISATIIVAAIYINRNLPRIYHYGKQKIASMTFFSEKSSSDGSGDIDNSALSPRFFK